MNAIAYVKGILNSLVHTYFDNRVNKIFIYPIVDLQNNLFTVANRRHNRNGFR